MNKYQTDNKMFIDERPHRISIKPIINHTSHERLDLIVYDSILKGLSDWPYIILTDYENCDFCLHVDVLSYTAQIPYTYDKDQEPFEYKIQITMGFVFEEVIGSGNPQAVESPELNPLKLPDNNKIYTIKDIQEDEIYRIYKNDIGASKRAERDALERLVKRVTKRAIDEFITLPVAK